MRVKHHFAPGVFRREVSKRDQTAAHRPGELRRQGTRSTVHRQNPPAARERFRASGLFSSGLESTARPISILQVLQ